MRLQREPADALPVRRPLLPHRSMEADHTLIGLPSLAERQDSPHAGKSPFGSMASTVGKTAVLQKRTGEHDGREAPLLFSLGGHSKQAGDERDLPYDILLFDTSHLPFPDHVHDLVSLKRVPCRFR